MQNSALYYNIGTLELRDRSPDTVKNANWFTLFMPAKKLENLLHSGASGSLEKLIRTAQDMDSLTSALRAALTSEIAENLLAANVREDGALVVICSSSAWASRIRFESDALLEASRASGFAADSLRVMVTQG
ncbi:MAG: DUF721 domain-containing protein [Gammaproteobacteria bacterium]|nr:DUF721 domain-containing protein [Gammaproteobacteria bacterium]